MNSNFLTWTILLHLFFLIGCRQTENAPTDEKDKNEQELKSFLRSHFGYGDEELGVLIDTVEEVRMVFASPQTCSGFCCLVLQHLKDGQCFLGCSLAGSQEWGKLSTLSAVEDLFGEIYPEEAFGLDSLIVEGDFMLSISVIKDFLNGNFRSRLPAKEVIERILNRYFEVLYEGQLIPKEVLPEKLRQRLSKVADPARKRRLAALFTQKAGRTLQAEYDPYFLVDFCYDTPYEAIFVVRVYGTQFGYDAQDDPGYYYDIVIEKI